MPGVGLRWECVSAFPTRFIVGIFLFTGCVGVAHGCLSETIYPMCSCRFGVSMVGGKFRGLLCHHLDQNLSLQFYIYNKYIQFGGCQSYTEILVTHIMKYTFSNIKYIYKKTKRPHDFYCSTNGIFIQMLLRRLNKILSTINW